MTWAFVPVTLNTSIHAAKARRILQSKHEAEGMLGDMLCCRPLSRSPDCPYMSPSLPSWAFCPSVSHDLIQPQALLPQRLHQLPPCSCLQRDPM